MGTQVVKHTSRGVDITLNFASTENNLSWSFIQEGDGEIYDVESNNVASYTIAGSPITPPYSVTNGTSYAVSVVKTTTGQPASITFKTRRAINKTSTLSVPDFGDLSVLSNYILNTDGTITVLSNGNISISNYAGGGTWTNSIIRSTITLPDVSSITYMTWRTMFHVKLFGTNYICVVGGCTSRNDAYPYAIACLLDRDSLNIYDLDFNINSYTQITIDNTVRIPSQAVAESGVWFNFVENKALLAWNDRYLSFDINTRNITNHIPYFLPKQNATNLKKKGYYNPIDNMYAGFYGLFSKDEGSHYSSDTSNYVYDQNSNAKLGTETYWGRLIWRDKKGLVVQSFDNTTHGGIANNISKKKDIVFLSSASYVGFAKVTTPTAYNRTPIENYNATSIIDVNYLDNTGTKYIVVLNNGRLLFVFCDTSNQTVTQAYYDTGKTPISECNDNILTTL